MSAFDVGHFRCHRHQIVGHVAIEKLTALVVKALFKQCRADALYHAAADLLVDELRIDDGAAVLHAPMFQKLYEAGVDIDFKIARLDTVGERKWPCARD